jgi:hypothetical protein
MKLDWQNVEDELYATWVADVRRFAAEHSDECYCSFGAVVEPSVGRVDLCLNTPESAKESFAQAYPYEYRPTPEEADEIKWNPGEWLYYNFNGSSEERWERFEEFMGEENDLAAGGEDKQRQISSRFFSLCHKVLVRSAKDGVYDCLSRTADFQLICYHFHGTVADARLEMKKALVEYNATGLKHIFHVEVDSA